MVKLLIDATALCPVAKGVGRYVVEVVRRLDHLLPQSWFVELVTFAGHNKSPSESKRIQIREVPPQSDLQLGLWTMPRLVRQTSPDIYLRLGDTVGRRYPVGTITVCHDINELIFQAQACQRGLVRTLIDNTKEYFRILGLRYSDFVICNSLFTQSECATRYGIPEEKTSVAYCGVDKIFYEGDADQAVRNIQRRFACQGYVLTFACGDPRENYAILPDVIVESKKCGGSIVFAIGGIRQDQAYVRVLSSLMASRNLSEGIDYVFIPFLTSAERSLLRDLYLAADYYLELSLHEGFGMQLAEAMACGVSCLAPRHSALTEVGGEFVIPIDPKDPKAIADALEDSYINQHHFIDHSDQIQFTKKFSWDRSALEISLRLLQVYQAGTKG